jgi:type I restriction enzyme, S subunit
MAVDLAYLPKFLQEMPANFGDELRLAVVSELESEGAIFVQDGNHGEYRPRKDEFVDEGVPFIRPPNLEHGRIDFSKCDRINELAFARVHKGIGQGGDIILTSNATIGRLAITKPTDPVFVANPQTTIYRSTSPKTLDQRYLYYFMCSDGFQQQLLAHTGRNSTFDYVSLTKQRSLVIPIPSHHHQRKIASILSAYDDLIENNTRRIAILEEMAQAIYREWFVNFRFPGHENVKLVQSTLGMIPEGWKVTVVGDLAVNERRSVNPQEVDARTPYVGLEHMPRKSITLTDWGLASEIESTKHRFLEGEILFGKIRPYFHKVVVAPFDGICSSDAIVIVPRKDDYFSAVLCCVSSAPFVDHATQTSQGTKMPRANWDVLTKYPLPLPPADLLGRFNEVVRDIVSTLKTLMLKNNNLRTTRDLLLPKLISGKLDVEELDIDLGMTSEALEEATG